MMDETNINIFVGHFGSGKTEVAVNFALKSIKNGKKTVLVDLDIINPFFRSAEIKTILEKRGIELIIPNFAGTNIDIPSLSSVIYSVFNRNNTNIIFDVGGDEDGARALGQYKKFFEKSTYKMYYVINTLRPFTTNKENIIELYRKIEEKSRIKITDLINNTNLSYETKVQDILEGKCIVEEVSKIIDIPVAFNSYNKELVIPKNVTGNWSAIDLFMQPKFYEV